MSETSQYEMTDEQFLSRSVKSQNLIIIQTFNGFREDYNRERSVDRERLDMMEKKIRRQWFTKTPIAAISGFLGGIAGYFVKSNSS